MMMTANSAVCWIFAEMGDYMQFQVVLRQGLLKICTCLYGDIHRNNGERVELMGSTTVPKEKVINLLLLMSTLLLRVMAEY